MRKSYAAITTYESQNFAGSHRLNEYGRYSTFNAGAGEESLISILDTLLSAPLGSLIVIEEIEVGLHPTLMEPLLDEILRLAAKRLLQVLIVTHSTELLRTCPKECLVLAERQAQQVIFTHQPHFENAIRSLAGKSDAALHVVCEDEWAATLVEAALTRDQKKLVMVKGYGSKTELYSKAQAIKTATSIDAIVVWDGDVAPSIVHKKHGLPEVFRAQLPVLSPEIMIIEAIVSSVVKEDLIAKYKISEAEWEKLRDRLASLTDPHDVFHVLTEELSVSNSKESIIGKEVCEIVQRAYDSKFDALRESINVALGKVENVSDDIFGVFG